ncbi:MAG TPA: crosslink repair DNA glycosylase YcaQ family protein [Mycetocola sp.]|nr:crosslink repair DNA glycosylase YcaQ family protein [Mycetocola sp.]
MRSFDRRSQTGPWRSKRKRSAIARRTGAGVRALADGPVVSKTLLATQSRRAVDLRAARRSPDRCHGALLDEWAPPARARPNRDEAVVDLAIRYFTSHGPATESDFAWWAHLTLAAAHNR